MNPPDARRDVHLFLVLLMAISSVFYGFVLFVPGARDRWLSYSAAFMWCPGVAALLTQWLRHRTLRGLGWTRGGLRYYLVAYALPLAICIPTYLLVWLVGPGGFNREALEAGRAQLGLPGGVAGDLALVALALIAAPAGIVATLGEEIGWRGFLVPRLAVLTDLTRTSLLTGVIWALWHYPVQLAVLPVFLPGLPVWYATACFTFSVVGISFAYTWLRMRSGSVWPAALCHAASNAFQGAFESLTRHDEWTSYVTYEFGMGFALTIAIIAIPFWRDLRKKG